MGILSSVVAYITRIVMARSLSATEYGLFSAVFTLIMFFLFFRDLGMEKAVSKYIPEFLVNREQGKIKSGIFFVVAFQMLSSLVMVTIFLFLNSYLAKNYFKDPSAERVLLIMVFYIFGSVIFRIYRAIAGGYQEMKLYAMFEFLKNLFVLGLFSMFFYFGFGVLAAALAWASVCYLVVIIMTPFLFKKAPFLKHQLKDFWPTTKMIFVYGVPVFATGVAGKFISYIDTLILTQYRTLAEVGVYNVVLPSALIFLKFGGSISAVFFPMFSELWARKDKTRMREGLKMLHRYLFVLVIPPAIGIFAFSRFLIKTFFGSEYVSGTLALQILMFGMFVYVVATVNNSIISAIGYPKVVAKIIIFVSLFNIVGNILLIPRFGIEGAALTTTLSYLITLILSTYKVRHFIKVKLPWFVWLKLSFAGFVFFGVVKIFREILVINQWWELVISCTLALLVYLGIVYAYGIVDIKEFKKYIGLVKK